MIADTHNHWTPTVDELLTLMRIRNGLNLSINVPQKSNANQQPLIQWTVADGEPNQSWVFHRHGQAFRWNNLLIAAPDAGGPIGKVFAIHGGDLTPARAGRRRTGARCFGGIALDSAATSRMIGTRKRPTP
jgi:hypothetical protein